MIPNDSSYTRGVELETIFDNAPASSLAPQSLYSTIDRTIGKTRSLAPIPSFASPEQHARISSTLRGRTLGYKINATHEAQCHSSFSLSSSLTSSPSPPRCSPISLPQLINRPTPRLLTPPYSDETLPSIVPSDETSDSTDVEPANKTGTAVHNKTDLLTPPAELWLDEFHFTAEELGAAYIQLCQSVDLGWLDAFKEYSFRRPDSPMDGDLRQPSTPETINVSETTTENHTQQTTSHYLVNDVASTIELKTTHLEPCSSIYDKPSPTYPTDDIPSQTELNTSHFDSFSSVYEKPSPNPWTNDRPLIDVPQYQPSVDYNYSAVPRPGCSRKRKTSEDEEPASTSQPKRAKGPGQAIPPPIEAAYYYPAYYPYPAFHLAYNDPGVGVMQPFGAFPYQHQPQYVPSMMVPPVAVAQKKQPSSKKAKKTSAGTRRIVKIQDTNSSDQPQISFASTSCYTGPISGGQIPVKAAKFVACDFCRKAKHACRRFDREPCEACLSRGTSCVTSVMSNPRGRRPKHEGSDGSLGHKESQGEARPSDDKDR